MQKEEMQERLIALKEELCRMSPEALEEIEREATQRHNCEEEPPNTTLAAAKKNKPGKNAGKIAKKGKKKSRT
jgi:hypothetical protein